MPVTSDKTHAASTLSPKPVQNYGNDKAAEPNVRSNPAESQIEIICIQFGHEGYTQLETFVQEASLWKPDFKYTLKQIIYNCNYTFTATPKPRLVHSTPSPPAQN